MKELVNRFNEIAKSNQTVLDKFTVDFAKNPAYALGWSNDVFRAAARVKIAQDLAKAFENEGVTVVKIRALLSDRIVQRAKYPPQSTSPVSNLMEEYETAAYAEALEVLNYE